MTQKKLLDFRFHLFTPMGSCTTKYAAEEIFGDWTILYYRFQDCLIEKKNSNDNAI